MMAALYLLMTFVIGSIYLGKRNLAIIIIILTLIGCWLMLWHHATDQLKINW